MRKLIVGLSLALVVVFLSTGMLSSSAKALTRTVVNGILMGASDVIVNGIPYDVEFVDGTAQDIFDGCDEPEDFVFHSEVDGYAASLALIDQVFLDTTDGDFDSYPNLTFGLPEEVVGGGVLTPYEISPDSPEILCGLASNYWEVWGWSDGADVVRFDITVDTTDPSLRRVYAVWTATAVPAPSTVPEPSTILLLGGGLVGIGVLRRKLKQR